ncbi:MAG: hypothetical protein JGK24_08655 [Microcoleus sp. PH2017_29_MFU_D_A]|uniref:hypothetical protein n=1 Tax=unclassified Microcoleus TaxID=2642155 RepID=UPI001D3C6BAA|nr:MULTISPECIES: hypothetical protein [unclassified Microcoleus]MCC3503964.1 hypothetical protein [Microcoleus sp. PH2017_19_SFW_U_A]TAE53425.1 MAG: hypothetical protein EAZ88_11990 [Oscillatoriales cyanobacterium]MCC3473675.1 hypothetical protein [Microcoleus sp. PH2017_13_LAR_U_A]MCC3486081.1 hypothetical protein [Microcoleus sp. PH2017_14_LAR_D_A]MCC3490439.1 hypothetical protein [Microcoleus sp. PH2017_16_JOR_D_A]
MGKIKYIEVKWHKNRCNFGNLPKKSIPMCSIAMIVMVRRCAIDRFSVDESNCAVFAAADV